MADKKKTNSLDTNKIVLIIVAFIFLFALFYIVFMRRTEKRYTSGRRYDTQGLSKQTAFNITARKDSAPAGRSHGGSRSGSSVKSGRSSFFGGSTSRVPGIDTRGPGLGVEANYPKIDQQLDTIFDQMKKEKKIVNYPPTADKNTRDMLDAERDETYLDAGAALNRNDLETAEKLYKEVIKNANGNKFKELFAYGGLMEVYDCQGKRDKYKEAFAEYAKKAQELKDVYGPMADSIAAAYQMLDQIQHVDSGTLKQALTKYNLEHKTNLQYEELMEVCRDKQGMLPDNLEMSKDYAEFYSKQKR